MISDKGSDFAVVVGDVTIYCNLTVPEVRIVKIRRPRLRLHMYLNTYSVITTGDRLMYSLKSTDQVSLGFTAEDEFGNPTTVESATWSSSDDTVVTVTADAADFTKAMMAAVGPVGVAQVTLSVDARFGADVNTLTGLLDVTVVAGEASMLVITPGEPSAKPVVTPTPAPVPGP